MRYQLILESQNNPGHVFVVTTLGSPEWSWFDRDMDICCVGRVELDGVYGERFEDDENVGDIEHSDFNGLLDGYFKDSLSLSMDRYGVNLTGMSDWNTRVNIISIDVREINDDGTCGDHPELHRTECPCARFVRDEAIERTVTSIDYTIDCRPVGSATLRRGKNDHWLPILDDCNPYSVEELRRDGLDVPDGGFETPEQYEDAMRKAGFTVERV